MRIINLEFSYIAEIIFRILPKKNFSLKKQDGQVKEHH